MLTHLSALITLWFMVLCASVSQAMEINGKLSAESIWFPTENSYPGQEDYFFSPATNMEGYHDFTDNLRFSAELFARVDSEDKERTQADIRQAELLYFTDNWEISGGISKVFWGTTEFVHIVDIINQSDMAEDFSGEEKLGQPMLHLSFIQDWGVIEGFFMPWFRERTFPGIKSRFRPPVPIDTNLSQYESSSKQHNPDFALRYSTTIGSADVGLAWFNGTSREPALLLHQSRTQLSLQPYYQQINQLSFDLQMTQGEWLIKAEGYHRTGQSYPYCALTGGVEYTISGIGGSLADLGLIAEYIFDDRDQDWIPTSFDNDLMAGLRLSLNDQSSTTILLGISKDVNYGSTATTVKAERRIGENWKLTIEGAVFLDVDDKDPAITFANDDFIQAELAWYW